MTVSGAAYELVYGAAAAVYAFLLLLLLLSKSGGATRALLAGGCAGTAIWAAGALTGLTSDGTAPGIFIDVARAVLWCGLLIHLLRRLSGKRRDLGILSGALIIVAALTVAAGFAVGPAAPRVAALGCLAIAICGVFLADNLYRATAPEGRWHVNLLFVGIGGMFACDVVFAADALLFGQFSTVLAAGRPIVAIVAAPLLALAAARNRDWAIDIHVSRDAVYHTGSLIVSGLFLLGLAAIGEAVRVIGPEWGALAEIALIAGGAIGVGLSLTSGSARSRLRHLLVDHFFSHRYDYRKEWLRCIETLSARPDERLAESRIVRALAAVTDSPGGQLWTRDPAAAAFHWSASWNLPAAIGAEPADSAFVAGFRGGDWVVEIDRAAVRPEWLAAIAGAWLAVPLTRHGRMLGFAVLLAPRAPFRLDREVFDLLRIVGQQAAAHVVERQHARAMLETESLREFGKRFAFAVHDMKNVASQLAMIVQNAARVGDDPEFHRDVLVTVEASLAAVNGLIGRLRPGSAPAPRALCTPFDIVSEEIAAIARTRGARIALQDDSCRTAAAIDGELLRGVIAHLCDNAIEASAGPVTVCVGHDRGRALIDITDSGAGMTAEFVRDRLFLPFGSTKESGLGIGAYQARELIRSAGGDLLVHSRPGGGTTMRIVLPAVAQPADPPLLSPA
ncbi:MAG TPA: XrtA/PEP-CTERM system histidine kinase PrsK [Stellaceae bacterium]|nr:XrtA/PEP-CTERM system histidine kinase PrsK [Stellaceae bacterium]